VYISGDKGTNNILKLYRFRQLLYCFRFGFVGKTPEANIRIDTHKDNRIMQHNIEKHGFTYCGIIYLANGDERLAYQKLSCSPRPFS